MKGAPLEIHDGTAEVLKLFALVVMVLDHVNKYLFNGTLLWLYELGRVCAPLFIIIMAYNLARPYAIERGIFKRLVSRLLVVGLVSSVPFVALGGLKWHVWPLNIFFTLLCIASAIYLIEQRLWFLAALLVVVGGAVVEFWWQGVALGICSWAYFRGNSRGAVGAVIALLAFYFINLNFWALCAVPLLFWMARFDLPFPRLRWLFYSFYPAHLAILWLVRIPMRHAGYLFF